MSTHSSFVASVKTDTGIVVVFSVSFVSLAFVSKKPVSHLGNMDIVLISYKYYECWEVYINLDDYVNKQQAVRLFPVVQW